METWIGINSYTYNFELGGYARQVGPRAMASHVIERDHTFRSNITQVKLIIVI